MTVVDQLQLVSGASTWAPSQKRDRGHSQRDGAPGHVPAMWVIWIWWPEQVFSALRETRRTPPACSPEAYSSISRWLQKSSLRKIVYCICVKPSQPGQKGPKWSQKSSFSSWNESPPRPYKFSIVQYYLVFRGQILWRVDNNAGPHWQAAKIIY